MTESTYIKPEPYIKPDPEAVTASPLDDDDDLYEDAGDLEFFDQYSDQGSFGQAYLARVPRDLWEAWDSLPDDAEIEVGTMRQWDVVRPDGSVEHRFKMLLNSDRAEHQLMPKEYDLEMGKELARSTFVFTEEDLPGFKAKSKARTDAANAGIPARFLRPKADKVEKKPFEKGRRWQPYYRKAIPKKTKIAARIQYELACKPVDNAESQAILQRKQLEAQRPKHTLQIMEQRAANSIIHHGSAAAVEKFGSFIKTSAPTKATKPKKAENRAARMSEEQLLDGLMEAFRKYEYWKMSILKARFDQPEAFLRQTLEKIAVLNRSGIHANEWSLQDHLKSMASGATSETAPEEAAAEDDEEEVAMEDVV
ncbi:transcription initiation factor IIF [Colletotrichum eremochloae]|uniref:Transcription initiation factor IIF subunit beta n=1 Tax=Colletotrichum sublineola TaxID=1173701 RepID=A0A066XW28_COLSU|nr:transcription initiation factor IIF [Colletotrichum sublineola]KAK2010536.1 transcription initiation factor IIF [Colletotrichum eremochloae]KDN70150.1 putative transcription initiation factor IIF [Colletotrichum sublineola]